MCQLDIDECTRNPCQSGGTCLNFFGGFKCICSSNVTGEYCTEAVRKPEEPSSSLNITLEELLCILAVFLGCVMAVLLLGTWQRWRWRHKRHQQNNRVKLTDHHVKNDLKANDAPKRNSKICNVEADQVRQTLVHVSFIRLTSLASSYRLQFECFLSIFHFVDVVEPLCVRASAS